MKMQVMAGSPGKIRVMFDSGEDVEIDNHGTLYGGLHQLAAAVEALAAPEKEPIVLSREHLNLPEPEETQPALEEAPKSRKVKS